VHIRDVGAFFLGTLLAVLDAGVLAQRIYEKGWLKINREKRNPSRAWRRGTSQPGFGTGFEPSVEFVSGIQSIFPCWFRGEKV